MCSGEGFSDLDFSPKSGKMNAISAKSKHWNFQDQFGLISQRKATIRRQRQVVCFAGRLAAYVAKPMDTIYNRKEE